MPLPRGDLAISKFLNAATAVVALRTAWSRPSLTFGRRAARRPATPCHRAVSYTAGGPLLLLWTKYVAKLGDCSCSWTEYVLEARAVAAMEDGGRRAGLE
jgi:hypothetical protein